jgi:Holliday junction resolvase
VAKPGGKAPRRSGNVYENEVVVFLKALGLGDAKRVPLSGAVRGFKDDIHFTMPGCGKATIECKLRGDDNDRTKVLRSQIGDADMLFTRRKGHPDDHWIFMGKEFFVKLVTVLLHQHETLKEEVGLDVTDVEDALTSLNRLLSRSPRRKT